MNNNIPQSADLNQSQNLPLTVPTKPNLNLFKILLIIGIIIFILVVGLVSYILGQTSVKPSISIIPTITQTVQKACTQEAKICPDGSSVGRTGPDCEFAKCSSLESSNSSTSGNMREYFSNINLYKISVPTDWIVNDTQGVFLNIPGEVVIGPESEMERGIYGTVITIFSSDSSERYSLDTQQQFDELYSSGSLKNSKSKISEVNNIKINGNRAIQFVSKSSPGKEIEAFYLLVTWVRNNGKNYYIELSGNEETVNQYTSVYNKMVATFQFIDKIKVSPTINIYKSSDIISKYPNLGINEIVAIRLERVRSIQSALEFYSMDNKIYPDKFEQLIPKYLVESGIDLSIDKELEYKALESGRNYQICTYFELDYRIGNTSAKKGKNCFNRPI